MNNNLRKLLIFCNDYDENTLGNLCYVKFLDEDRKHAIFYRPLIAPKNLKQYLEQNSIEQAYEVVSDDVLKKYYNCVFVFESEGGVYTLKDEIPIEKKLVLLVDKGMEIDLDLPKFLYQIKDDTIITKPYKNGKVKEYCYVANECDVNDELKRIMIPVEEVIPGVLSMSGYSFGGKVKNKLPKHD